MNRAFLGSLALVGVLAVAGLIYQALATEMDERNHPPPGEMVDVGGHKLHINCVGEGSPTVLLESGLGENSLTWSRVQPELAETTRVCAYDRAGLGWSEPGPSPRDSQQVAGELHRLLEDAGVEGPYVLVGHSLGGLHARVFAEEYPDAIAGVVLVDSSHEDQPFPGAEVSPELPEPAKAAFAAGNRQAEKQLTLCQVLTPFGVVRLSGINEWLELPARVRAEAEAASNRSQTCSTAARERAAMAESAARAREAGTLGDVPLIVLSRGAPANIAGLSTEEAGQQEAWEEAWRAWQEDLVGLSPDGRRIVAEKSGHYIQIDQPKLVVDATGQVIEEAQVGHRGTR